jgi:cytochrome c oxidase cbb3-type subunit 4
MDINDLRSFITLATFLCFLGICWWAYRSPNKSRFEHDALLPFEDEELDEMDGGGEER